MACDPKRDAQELYSRLTEAVVDVYGALSYLNLRDRAFDAVDGYGPLGVQTLPPHYAQNTKRGEVLPVYRTEHELRYIRDRSRILCYGNEFAISGVENRVNYVVGDGFRYTHPDPNAQAILDACVEVNDFSGLEAEALRRADRDGEFFIRLFEDPDDCIYRLRFVEPEHVRAPGGDAPQTRDSYGVRTKPQDAESVEGYWIVDDPLGDPNPAYVDASEVVHGKLNVDRSAKRGLPTYYPVESNLRRCEDLLASMTATAKTRAKVAMIRKLSGVTSTLAENLVRNLTEVNVSDPATGQSLNVERLRYGTILTAPANVNYEIPQTTVGASDLVEVLQAELRAVGARLQMAEWMFTGKADNTYSNAFAAESPTLRSFVRLQSYLARLFGRSRHGRQAALLWRQLRRAVSNGDLHRESLHDPITVTPPTLEVRDPQREALVGMQYLQGQVWSLETVREKSGVDPAKEAERVAREQPSPEDGSGPADLFESRATEAGPPRAGLVKKKIRTKDGIDRTYYVRPDEGEVADQNQVKGKKEQAAKGKARGGRGRLPSGCSCPNASGNGDNPPNAGGTGGGGSGGGGAGGRNEGPGDEGPDDERPGDEGPGDEGPGDGGPGDGGTDKDKSNRKFRSSVRSRFPGELSEHVTIPAKATAFIHEVAGMGGDAPTTWEYFHAAIVDHNAQLKAEKGGFDLYDGQGKILDDAKTSNRGGANTFGWEDAHKRSKIQEWRKHGTDHVVRFTVLSTKQQGLVVGFGFRPGAKLSTAGNVIDLSDPDTQKAGLTQLDEAFRIAIAANDPSLLPSVKLAGFQGKNASQLVADAGKLSEEQLTYLRKTNIEVNEIADKYREGMRKMNEETALQIEAEETEATVSASPEAALKGINNALAKMSPEKRGDFLVKQYQGALAQMSPEEAARVLAALQQAHTQRASEKS